MSSWQFWLALGWMGFVAVLAAMALVGFALLIRLRSRRNVGRASEPERLVGEPNDRVDRPRE